MNFANITLGGLLSSNNETIKRNAFSILKQLQKERDATLAKCRHGVYRFENLPTCRECTHQERNAQYKK